MRAHGRLHMDMMTVGFVQNDPLPGYPALGTKGMLVCAASKELQQAIQATYATQDVAANIHV